MPIHEALNRLIVEFDEKDSTEGEVRAHGLMSFGEALKGPPGRLHGGHHALVRTLPILERITAHEHARTFPCEVDVAVQRALPLEETVPFEATYRPEGEGWELTTRLQGTDRLLATARSLVEGPLMDETEVERWRALYQESRPADRTFLMFGVTHHISENAVWCESHDPRVSAPESEHARLVQPDGTLGPAFVGTQLDAVGAVARGTLMRHPHFTKRIEIQFGVERFPAGTHVICIADRAGIEEDETSTTAKVEIKGERYGTAVVRVAMFDAAFETVYATGRVTVHPVDPEKFEALQKMRQLRQDT